MSEEDPEPPPENDAERYPDDDPDHGHNRRLPGERGGELSLGEAERLQQGEIAAAAPDRRDEREAECDDGSGSEPGREKQRRGTDGSVVLDQPDTGPATPGLSVPPNLRR